MKTEMSDRPNWRDLPPVSEDEQPESRDRLSVTWLKTADRCDRAAMLSLNYSGGAGSDAMNRGSVFHAVVADLTRQLIREEETKIPGELGKLALYEYLDEHPEMQVSALERDALRAMIWNWCEGSYFGVPVIALETTVTLEIGGFTVVGRVDLAEDFGGGVLGITDYKTSYAMSDSEEFKAQSFDDRGEPRFAGDFQTSLYALLLAEGTLDDGMPLGDYERFKLRLVYPRYLRSDGLACRETIVTRQQLLDFKLDIEHQLRRVREVNFGERKWAATPGSHCAECTAPNACPLPAILRPESQHADMSSLADLEKAGAAWLFMSQRAANLKRRVKKAAERIGDETPDLLELPGGDKGVMIGSDLALIFLPKESETIIDKAALQAAIDASVNDGVPFDRSAHFRHSEGVAFEKRKIGPRPRNGGSDE